MTYSRDPQAKAAECGDDVRVGVYVRRSTDDEHQPYSIEAPDIRLAAYIGSQPGWRLAARFADDASGAGTNRPGLQRALAAARAGVVDVLLVYRVDRLTRSLRDLVTLLDDLNRAGVVFRSATEPFDTATAIGRMLVQMLGMFAQFERDTIIDRAIAGMERKAAAGKWKGGRRPFGYQVNPATRTLIPHPDEAPLVRLLFGLYTADRLGGRTIARTLNDCGKAMIGTRAHGPQPRLPLLHLLHPRPLRLRALRREPAGRSRCRGGSCRRAGRLLPRPARADRRRDHRSPSLPRGGAGRATRRTGRHRPRACPNQRRDRPLPGRVRERHPRPRRPRQPTRPAQGPVSPDARPQKRTRQPARRSTQRTASRHPAAGRRSNSRHSRVRQPHPAQGPHRSAHCSGQDHRTRQDSPGLPHTAAASSRPAAGSCWPSEQTLCDRRRSGSRNDQFGGAGGARTHDRQIMRKPARPPLVLAESLHHPSVLVSQDLAERGGTGQDGAGWDRCSHSVPIRRA